MKGRILGFLFLTMLIPSSYGAENMEIKGPNISGSLTMPEPISQDAIKVFSTAGGKVAEIKNNSVIVLENKDMGIKISGFIKDASRGDKVKILILRPDDSIYATGAYLNDYNSYMTPTKLHTKWVPGLYEILVNFKGEDEGKIRFFVTDKESAAGQIDDFTNQPEKLSQISKYLDGTTTKDELVSYLREIGWSKFRIDNFLANNQPKYFNPYIIFFLVALLSLLYILISILSMDKSRKIRQGRT